MHLTWLSNSLRQFYKQWLHRRIPPNQQQSLYRKNIFILPSKAGVFFLVVVLLLWLLGTNYQNNIILILSFLLLSLVNTCILYTYSNLSGLSLQIKKAYPCFAGEYMHIECVIKNNSQRPYNNIVLRWQYGMETVVNVSPYSSQEVTLLLAAPKRGVYKANRLIVSSIYPLGLIRAWAHLDMDVDMLVYPKPIAAHFPDARLHIVEDDQPQENQESIVTTGEFDNISHVRHYQEGDPPKHIAWKNYAKGQGLTTKIFNAVAHAESQQWLDWDDFSGFSIEGRLSRLCHCILQASEQELVYGLRLPTKTIGLGTGKMHKQALLRELALYKGEGN